MIDDKAKAKLSQKLVDLVNHASKLKEDKKELMKSYAEQIKEVQAKVDCIGKAVKAEDTLVLLDAFDSLEIESLLRGVGNDRSNAST